MMSINETRSNIGSTGNSRINDGIADLCMRITIRPSDQLNRMHAIIYMIMKIVAYAKEQGLESVPVEDNDDKETIIGLIAILRHAAKYYEYNEPSVSKASMKLKRYISEEKGIKNVETVKAAADELFNLINEIGPCTIDLENEEVVNKLFNEPEYLNQILIW